MSTDSPATCRTPSITADCTVDAVIARSESARAVLHAHKIDTCCGGRDSIAEAAIRADLDTAALVALLEAAAHDAEPVVANEPLPIKACACGCR